jgi:plasmid stabilization system protein ParE
LRPDILPNLRVFCYRKYGIYYHALSDQVRVERALHGAMNVSAADFGL